jgi:hypothetical protein
MLIQRSFYAFTTNLINFAVLFSFLTFLKGTFSGAKCAKLAHRPTNFKLLTIILVKFTFFRCRQLPNNIKLLLLPLVLNFGSVNYYLSLVCLTKKGKEDHLLNKRCHLIPDFLPNKPSTDLLHTKF